MSSGVTWCTATDLSGISATTCAFKLSIHHSVTLAQWGWTTPIQKWFFTCKAASTPTPLVLSLSNRDMLHPDTTLGCYTREELTHAMQTKRVSHQPTCFIFYKFWKWKQMTFASGIIQIINLKHRNLNSFSLFHCTYKDIPQLYPLKWRHQKLQYIFSVSFPKITLPNKLREIKHISINELVIQDIQLITALWILLSKKWYRWEKAYKMS